MRGVETHDAVCSTNVPHPDPSLWEELEGNGGSWRSVSVADSEGAR